MPELATNMCQYSLHHNIAIVSHGMPELATNMCQYSQQHNVAIVQVIVLNVCLNWQPTPQHACGRGALLRLVLGFLCMPALATHMSTCSWPAGHLKAGARLLTFA